MALILKDRVLESTTVVGTGAATLLGAFPGYQSFGSVMSVGDTCPYAIVQSGFGWETGLATYSGTNTLTRTTVYESSNAGAAVSFGVGTKTVYIGLPASQAIMKGFPVALASTLAVNGATIGAAAFAVNGNSSLGGTLAVAANSASTLLVQNAGGITALQVDASIVSMAAGIKMAGAVTGGLVAISAIDSGANTSISLDGKGAGNVRVGFFSSGGVSIGFGGGGVTISSALTYGGVALSNAVTGTGNMVLSASPTFTGTITAANLTTTAATLGTGVQVGSPTGGDKGAGTINLSSGIFINGVAVSGTGTVTSIAAGYGIAGGTITTSGTHSVSLTTVTNTLAADVSMTVNGTYFDGPSCAQGTTGTWFAHGQVQLLATVADVVTSKLWDGTTVVASETSRLELNPGKTISLSGIFTNPAANIRISCTANDTTTKMTFNTSGFSKDSTLTVVRIA